MQIQENIEYDVKALLQTVLDTMKTLRHNDNVAYPNPIELRRTAERYSIYRKPKSASTSSRPKTKGNPSERTKNCRTRE